LQNPNNQLTAPKFATLSFSFGGFDVNVLKDQTHQINLLFASIFLDQNAVEKSKCKAKVVCNVSWKIHQPISGRFGFIPGRKKEISGRGNK